MKLLLACAGFLCVPLLGQQAATPAAWDDSPRAADLAERIARLKPLLNQLVPEDWAARGADVTYVYQWRTAQEELAGLAAVAAQFDLQPKKLTLALDTYFRLQSLEWRVESLAEGARKYQSPAIADEIANVLRGNSANRDALRVYITDAAASQEQELTVVTQDAQGCRTELSQIPAAARRPTATKR